MLLLIVTTLKLLAEIALMALVGQWVLGLLAGPGRDRNPFYRLLAVVTAPVVGATRRIAPRRVGQQHLPLVALLLLALAWFLATAAKIALCVQLGVHACR